MPSRLPTFVIIGAMRSGTTSMNAYLRAHPDVFVAPTKELHFFDAYYDKGLEWYRSQFAGAGEKRAVGEATPDYMYDPRALERMASVLPDARLIAILRNPVDRAYSHYWHSRARGKETLSFEQALEAEPERLAAGGASTRAHSYLDRGRYLSQLRHVCAHYPRQALHVLLFDDVRSDPVGAFQELCGFLGVDPSIVPPALGASVNRYTGFRSVRLRRLAKRLPPRLKDAVGLLNRRVVDYPPMDPALRARLVHGFEDDNAALAAWLGRDLSAWNR